jgi:hypothetical protein
MRGWGWGDWWGLFCIGVTILAANMGDLEGWWIFLLLAGVLGYIGLNYLQRRIEAEELEEFFDEDPDVARLEESIASLRRVARDFRTNREISRALEIEATLEEREAELRRALARGPAPTAIVPPV